MKIVVHTKYGVFYSKEQKYTEELYEELVSIVDKIPTAKYFCFDTESGMVVLSEKMIQDSLFVIEK